MIDYYSTEGNTPNTSFKNAILSGLAPDRGLYIPNRFNKYTDDIFSISSFSELSFEIAKLMIEDSIPTDILKDICTDAFNFAVPIKKIKDNINILELFHGPTAAFKDFGARFMARVMSYFIGKSENSNTKITILVATSGDTGSAVARGFYKVPNIDVVILYPQNKVSFLQEKQLTTLGENITALEVKGTFDDCQFMVKEAFIDSQLNDKINLSSANSINIGRLLPQSFYYTWAYSVINNHKKNDKIIFCTPSGNFGNLTGGLIAKKMGLPVEKFIAATNANDVVPKYLIDGVFSPRSSIQTYSNAMDVGNPSNFARMKELYKTKESMTKDIVGYSATDDETIQTIKSVYNDTGYMLDPHSAVGFKSIKDYLLDNPTDKEIILLGTAHPAKFSDVIKNATGVDIDIPQTLQEALDKEKNSIVISNKYNDLKEYLFSLYS